MASCGASRASASRPASSAASRASGSRWAARQWRRGDHRDVLERRGERGPVARPLGRQQVRDDGARHQLVADPEALVGLRAHEAVLERLGEPGGEVALEAAGAATGQRRRPRRQAAASAGPRSRRPPRARRARSIGRSAGASSRSTRRHSGERRVRRAATRSASEPVSVALLSSRRAATSSSTTSGEPADRSATRTTIEADGRSPVDSLDQRRRSRAARAGARSTRTGGRRPASMTGEVLAQRMLPGQPVGLVGQRRGRSARRARSRAMNVANERVAASAAWRSSSTSTIGPLGGDPAQPAEQGLERPRLAALGVGEVAGRAVRARRSATLGHAREAQQDRAGVAGQQRVDLLARALGAAGGPSGIEHGRPGRVDGSVGLPAEDERRLGAADDPVERLVEEAASRPSRRRRRRSRSSPVPSRTRRRRRRPVRAPAPGR